MPGSLNYDGNILPGSFFEEGEAYTDTANGTKRFFDFVAYHDGACLNYVSLKVVV